VYGFILQAVKGDKAAADAILKIILPENYPKNCCQFHGVSADQAGSSKHRQINRVGRWSR
jgi:hypothetical protein